MSPGDDERRPWQGAGSSSRLAGQEQRTTGSVRNGAGGAAPINVWAHAYLVVGTRGRCRLVLVVPSCVFCGRPHAHNGRPDFTAGKRTASCHEGRYVVHLGTVAGEVAA